MPKKFDMSQV